MRELSNDLDGRWRSSESRCAGDAVDRCIYSWPAYFAMICRPEGALQVLRGVLDIDSTHVDALAAIRAIHQELNEWQPFVDILLDLASESTDSEFDGQPVSQARH